MRVTPDTWNPQPLIAKTSSLPSLNLAGGNEAVDWRTGVRGIPEIDDSFSVGIGFLPDPSTAPSP